MSNFNFHVQPQWEVDVDVDVLTEEEVKRVLVLHNDDYNTFDFVIVSLMEVCDHTLEQAEQCTWLVHYKGKCEVKTGSYEFLEPMCTALLDRGLSAEIM
ncbi:ATP-dependent Clp protease adaptor ClpS [Moheibacter stercoris]|uniref:ATP-dependent Clp protease adaptor protein ClpS n=1 Tax=Moheibacter stercoris TaxID=1628251 RepID=A0ABV2LT05_9FLAO